MIMGIPAITFLAFIIQPIIIVAVIVYACNYNQLIKKPPFSIFSDMDNEFTDERGGK